MVAFNATTEKTTYTLKFYHEDGRVINIGQHKPAAKDSVLDIGEALLMIGDPSYIIPKALPGILKLELIG